MKCFDIEVYFRVCYYLIGSIVLAPLAIIPLIFITFKKNYQNTYLHSHFTWLKKAFIQTLPATIIIYYFIQILTFIFDHIWITIFGNDFISMLLGIGIIPLMEVLIVYIIVGKIYLRMKAGLKLLEEKKAYAILSE